MEQESKAKIFRNAVMKSIKLSRKSFVLKDNKQCKGKRFKDDDMIYSAILGAVIALNSKDIDPIKPILNILQGLELDTAMVKAGKFNPLIYVFLNQAASLDYKFENDLNYN
jgi:hypothetical protein